MSDLINNWIKPIVSRKYPTYRDIKLKSVHSWLAGKQVDDNAEGLWRIHDTLYDLTDFINKHPGGPSWIARTKGTDITEAFEAHHISTVPQQMLSKYKVRDVKTPRNIIFTFKENGFYKTLKDRVREKLKTVDYKPTERSDRIHTGLLISTFALSTLSSGLNSKVLAALSGVFLCWTVISAHNYFHRRDNWRMYTFNLSFMNYKDWRISHALSHHLYTNSLHDLELTLFEPIFNWIPNPHMKNWFQRYVSWIYAPIIYSGLFIGQVALRILYSITRKNILSWDELVVFSLPLAMYSFSGRAISDVTITWLAIEFVASFSFGLIGLNAAHHHPKIYHEGDAMREDKDWGLYQLDTVAERSDIRGSQFLVLTHFGNHALHHLFPTLDHGILPQLYPVLFKTMDEFKGELKDCNWLEHIIGQHKQLARVTPNKIPPGE